MSPEKTDKPPAVVIIARHGARIDAVNKEWHLTSPTPYDPPLTYGGWIQGRALGARIASLLKAREESTHDETLPTANNSSTSVASSSTSDTTASDSTHSRTTKKVRKHKVIIHSSPFLRCIQTSVAISAGISQFHRAENEISPEQTPLSSNPGSAEISPMASPARSSTPTSADQLTKHAAKDRLHGHGSHAKPAPRTRLRIDAFLGEWLSPDYFDQITPPPSSVMMVAGAKAELLRRGENIQRASYLGANSFSGNFPGGWKSSQSPVSADGAAADNGYFGMSALADALHSEGRLGSEDGHPYSRPVKAITIRDVLSRTPSHAHEDLSKGYVPPVPSYAISPSDPIPTGYVAHARDACVDVDYQWDSMRAPLSWGDGGEYGEEWSAMHKRYRSGLLKMLEWYSHEQPHKPHHRHHHNNHNHNHHHHNHRHHHNHDEDDHETDTVVILITHGAGCNALIGALTNQPVLIDVPMASLTMAVRRDVLKVKDTSNQSSDHNNEEETTEQHLLLSETPLHQIYDLSLIASTEHLRKTSNPLSIPQLPSPTLERSRSISAYRHRGGSNPIIVGSSNHDKVIQPPPRGTALQRAATINSAHHHYPNRNVSGLWGSSGVSTPAKESTESVIEEDAGPRQLEQRDSEPVQAKSTNEPTPLQTVDDAKSSSTAKPSLTIISEVRPVYGNREEQPKSQRGLWGSASTPQEREPAMKRRWTVTERH